MTVKRPLFLKKYSSLLPVLFVCTFFLVLSWHPSFAPILGILSLLFSLTIAISSIIKKHNSAENPRLMVARDILILMITLLLILCVGSLAGLFANYYVSIHFGTIAGFVSAIVVSFSVGYVIKIGIGAVTGSLARRIKSAPG